MPFFDFCLNRAQQVAAVGGKPPDDNISCPLKKQHRQKNLTYSVACYRVQSGTFIQKYNIFAASVSWFCQKQTNTCEGGSKGKVRGVGQEALHVEMFCMFSSAGVKDQVNTFMSAQHHSTTYNTLQLKMVIWKRIK